MTELQSKMRRAALYWLGRRDYSRTEITRKLQRKFAEEAEAEAGFDELLEWLEGHRFLDESRYLEVLIRSALERGHGLLRLRRDLQQRGLDKQLVEQGLAELEVDWFEQARNLRQRRFGSKPAIDQKEKARQLRYLQYRGFTSEQCFHALEMREEEF
jgi:regulatory protein